MQTNPVVEQNKNIKGPRVRGISLVAQMCFDWLLCVLVELSNGDSDGQMWLGWLETYFGRQKETAHDTEYDVDVS